MRYRGSTSWYASYDAALIGLKGHRHALSWCAAEGVLDAMDLRDGSVTTRAGFTHVVCHAGDVFAVRQESRTAIHQLAVPELTPTSTYDLAEPVSQFALGRRFIVASSGTRRLSHVDRASGETGAVDLTGIPQALALNREGTRAIVGVSASACPLLFVAVIAALAASAQCVSSSRKGASAASSIASQAMQASA